MDTLIQDLRYALRVLARKPLFSVIAVATLGLGIGASTSVFSVVEAVLLRPLPFTDPGRIVYLWESNPAKGFPQFPASTPNFEDWRSRTRSFESLAAFDESNVVLTADGEAERIRSAVVTPGFWDLLGVRPQLGRDFLAEEARAGSERVVMLSQGFWQRRFGGDPAVLERGIRINGHLHVVIGVLRGGVELPREADVWVPLVPEADSASERGNHWITVLGRTRPGVSVEAARREMESLAAQLAAEYPQSNEGWGVVVVPLHRQMVGDFQPTLLLLLAAVGLVLLLACANISHVLLARAAARRGEMAVRSALGAARGRLLRQLLTESLVLALLGGVAGVLVAAWGTGLLVSLSPESLPRLEGVRLNLAVCLFAVGASLATALFFGLAPALSAARSPARHTLAAGGRISGRLGRGRGLLVAGEIALAFVLLAGAALLAQSFLRLSGRDPGLQAEGVMTLRISLPRADYPRDEQAVAFFDRTLERIRALPGVEAAGAVNVLPLVGWQLSAGFSMIGAPEVPAAQRPSADYFSVTPGYFEALRIPLRRGRLFNEQDRAGSRRVALISETLARQHCGEDCIGRSMVINVATSEAREIVGVVGDIRHRGLDSTALAQVYEPTAQITPRTMSWVVRTGRDPWSVVPEIRRLVGEMDGNLPIFALRPIASVVADSVARQRFTSRLMVIFAGAALVLALMGVYGVVSYTVSLRTAELGIRKALGAQAGDLLRLVLKQGAWMGIAGLAVGCAGALGLARAMSSLLYGIESHDPATFTGVVLVLAGVVALACYVPARRAARVDPVIALRME